VIEDAPVEELERLLAKVDILEPLPLEELERLASLSFSKRGKPLPWMRTERRFCCWRAGGCGFTSRAPGVKISASP
jgi:hypothetical protein